MKIAIIGYSGSGKSTLAGKLGKKHGVQTLHLDTVHWLPGWKERSVSEEFSIVTAFLDEHDAWVIDGNYGKLLFDRRMEEADEIIFMSFSRFACLCRAFKRYFLYKGTSRESITEGCPEKIDLEFILWILHQGRTKAIRDRYKLVLKHYPEKVTVIKNQKQLSEFEKSRRL